MTEMEQLLEWRKLADVGPSHMCLKLDGRSAEVKGKTLHVRVYMRLTAMG